MTEVKKITDAEILHLLKHGEFPESVTKADTKVVVVMTQDWCHEWADMQAYLPDFLTDATIFELVYNVRDDFDRIMAFKEEIFGNMLIPYLRYYRNGTLIADTNWLPRATFAAMLQRDKPFKILN